MLAFSMQPSPASLQEQFSGDGSREMIPGGSVSDHLIALSDLKPQDHVKIVGRNAAAHLMALARSQCGSATSVHPDALCAQNDPADVLWITGVEAEDREPRIKGALRHLDSSRLVAIEFRQTRDEKSIAPFARHFAAKGLVACFTNIVGDSLIFVAARPAWLRSVL